MKFILCFLLLGFTLHTSAYSQATTGSVVVTVKDTRNEVVQGASVSLVRHEDSVQVIAGMTDKAGRLQLTGIVLGKYKLIITAVTFKPFVSSSFNIDSLRDKIVIPGIFLQQEMTSKLAEVVVTAKRPLIEQEIDKTIVNVASMISSATSNAFEVLEKTPGITVSPDGGISLNGRGDVLVLIDGRPTYMSARDLASYLKSIPGSLLDKIELIDNPSARYDASGNAIVNIKFRKNRVGGFTGSLSTGYNQGQYARTNSSINLNYNHKKLNLFTSVGYSGDADFSDEVNERNFFDTDKVLASRINLNNHQRFNGKGLNVSTGADYAASDRTSIGVLFSFNNSARNSLLNYESDRYNMYMKPDTTGSGRIVGESIRRNVGLNLNFIHKLKRKGSEISADLNYSSYTGKDDQFFRTNLSQADGSLLTVSEFTNLVPSEINIVSAKVDYVLPVKDNLRLEAGLKSSLVSNDSKLDFYNKAGSAQTVDYGRSNHFRYRENINAAYVGLQKSWKRIGAQLGIRAENTQATGNQLGNIMVQKSRFFNSYTRLFPAIFFNYKLDSAGRNTINFSITRRINRPNYQRFNPFIIFRDNYSYETGNPFLLPQYQNRYELRYTHKQLLRIGLSYNRFTNVIFQTTSLNDDVTIVRPENVARGFMLLLNTGISASPASWWRLNADVLLSKLGIRGTADSQPLNPNAYVARINVNNQLTFSKTLNAEVSGYFASKDLHGQMFTRPMFRASASLQKKIFNDKASIRITVDDIFSSWFYRHYSFGLKQAMFYQTRESDTRRFGLAFTYRFGNETFARKRRQRENASAEEKGRID